VDSGGEAADDAQTKLVRLITAVPKSVSREVFFRDLKSQLLQVYSSSLCSGDHMVARVTGLSISKICHLDDAIGVKIITDLARPVLAVHQKYTSESASFLIVEDHIRASVAILHHIFTTIPINPALLKCIMVSNVGRTMLSLNMFIISEYKLCTLANEVDEFCVKYLENLDPVAAAFEVLPLLFKISLPFQISTDVMKPETDCKLSLYYAYDLHFVMHNMSF